MFFRFSRIIKLGAKSLWLHRLRAILTTMGIIFGVSSVIAMLAIGEGASQEAQARIARLGSTNILIESVKPPESQSSSQNQGNTKAYGLTYKDAQMIRDVIPDVSVVVPIRRINQKAIYRNRSASIEVIGTVPWYTEISPMRLKEGRFLTEIDLHYKSSVCILDEQAADELFIFDDPIGQSIKIKGEYYTVVGVASTIGPIDTQGTGGLEQSSANIYGGVAGNVYICLSTFKSRFGEMKLQFTGGSRSMEKVELEQITIRVKSLEAVEPTRDVLIELLDSTHKHEDYKITVPIELIRQAQEEKRIFSIVLGSIAAISLLVGGIGIMNIMLATVSERTREIGIRRALGAKRTDIIAQFLTETLLLTIAGGLLGIMLGITIPYFVTKFGNMPTVVTTSSLILAFGISAAVGITFGWYPAYRAAHMDPIESLRHE